MLDLYKAYLGDLQSVGNRYVAANSFYMTVVTSLVGILALGTVDKPLSEQRVVIILMVTFFGMLVSWTWWQTTRYYHRLFRAKFETLRALETSGNLGFSPFECELKELQRIGKGGLLANEQSIPQTIGLFFFAVAMITLFLRP